MDIEKSTLIEFESERKLQSYIPPNQSNSFYKVGDGVINLFTIRDNIDDFRFDLFTDSGIINTGVGIFTISGDINDINYPYNNFSVIQNTTLTIDQEICISKGNLNIYGNLILKENSRLEIKNNGTVICYANSLIDIKNNVKINIENGSQLIIYGEIKIIQSAIDLLVDNQLIHIDSSAYFTIDTSHIQRNIPSIIDFNNQLKGKNININTQDTLNYTGGRIGYVWKGGTPSNSSSIVDITLLLGEGILGDFRLPVVGSLKTIPNNFHSLRELIVEKNTILYVSDNYKNSNYYNPELYIGVIIDNNLIPGKCIVKGKLIIDGNKSTLTLDRGGELYIEEKAELILRNNAVMRSSYNDDIVLYLNGTLIIDDIDQIKSFNKENILFGEKSKIIILNPDNGERRILFSTPDGILTSDLYRLFYDQIERVEYHIPNNTGILIDKYYEFYYRQMTKWYADRRIEKAVKDGLIVWDGGFIELRSNIIPWINQTCTLLEASRLFKSFASFDDERLKDVVNRFVYAGFNSILFRFIYDDGFHEIKMDLDRIKMKSIYRHPILDKYVLTTDNDGQLFLRNMVSNFELDTIINLKSKKIIIDDTHEVVFEL